MNELALIFSSRWTLAFLILMAVVTLLIGIYDFRRGSEFTPISVPVCQAKNCGIIPVDDARHSLLRIFHSYSLGKNDGEKWLGFKTNNLCILPAFYLRNFRSDPNLLKINETFSKLELADIVRDGDNWIIRPGAAIDSFIDAWKKLFNPLLAEKTCHRPFFRYYGVLIFLFLGLAYCSFRFRKQNTKKKS